MRGRARSRAVIVGVVVLAGIGCVLVIRHRDMAPSRTATNQSTIQTATRSSAPSDAGSSYVPGTHAGSLRTSDGRTRTYVIHIPTEYSSNTTYPLVLLFHGGGGTGTKVLDQTHFAEEADAERFIVVAPNGVANSWADGRGTTDAERQGVDDAGFVRQLIANLESRLPIDAKRIYATGVSNGGMMVERLGCELSDVLAAIGPDVGPLPSRIYPTCKPSPIPILGIQGGADPLVPVDGGDVKSSPSLGAGGAVASAAQTRRHWASVDGCNATPSVTHIAPTVNDGTSVDKYSYPSCTGSTAVTYYIVQGMGHAWPPNPAQAPRVVGKTSQNINATDIMWDFFATHHR